MKILFFAIENNAQSLKEEIKELQQVDPLISENIDEAITILKNNKILLVVAGGEQPQSVKLFDFIKKTGSNIPFIWYTQTPFDQLCEKDFYDVNPFNGYIDLKQSSDDLFKLVREIILRKENIEVSKFVRIDISRILKHQKLNADIYVKLSDNKVLKVINKDENYNKEQILKYSDKVKYLYVKTADYPSLIREMYDKLKEKLRMNTSIEVVLDAQIEGIKIVSGNIQNFKIDVATENMLNEITTSCIETVKKLSSLKNLLEHFMSDKMGYLHKHSLLIGYLTSLAALRMNWNTDSSLQKITFSAILHDSVLKSSKEAMIDSMAEIEAADLSKQDKQRIKMHALEASEMVRNMKDIPPDVDSIILTHHERPDGQGFPRGLRATQVSQIAALFIIGETFVNHIYDKMLDRDQCLKMIDKMKGTFEKGNYRTPYYAFKEMLETYSN